MSASNAGMSSSRASRGIPRQISNYVKNWASLADAISVAVAEEVVR